MCNSNKDTWDKLKILLTPVGGFLTASTIAIVTFLGTSFLEKRQDIEANVRLYAEIMSNRENADSSLRQEMFNTTLTEFLKVDSEDPTDKLLKLELLAYNFHDALDLGPLFEHLFEQLLDNEDSKNEANKERLVSIAKQVNNKQIEILEAVGKKSDFYVPLTELKDHPEGIKLEKQTLKLPIADKSSERDIVVEVLDDDYKLRKLLIRLTISPANSKEIDLDSVFWIGLFDFPAIRSSRLKNGDRCAVVLRIYDFIDVAEITLIYFPGSRASLKEKPYYDEIVADLIREAKKLREADKQ